MTSRKKLLQLARKWKMAAAICRKRISLNRTSSKKGSSDSTGASVAQKGHFTVYTTDGKRFKIPVISQYWGHRRTLCYGRGRIRYASGGAIVLPIDTSSMEYITSLIRRALAVEQENALLMSLTRCSSNVPANEADLFTSYVHLADKIALVH